MIVSVHGTLLALKNQSIVVQVGGVGLEVFVPRTVFNELNTQIGHPVNLRTSFIVREDSMALYGFVREEEHRIFELLLGVSGIGPRLALAALSTLTPETLANAIQQDDPDLIARVPGLGKKSAQKIILELKGKLLPSDMPPGLAAVSDLDTEVLAALTTLGYSIIEAQAALQSIPRDASQDVEERIVLALAYFS
ncbi:MAG: Holliday junction branch migration protein RuvA [Anaerolineae bacterium]|nr:Holliday junction branch migration protein RuvA [Anaerolineae bacterium]